MLFTDFIAFYHNFSPLQATTAGFLHGPLARLFTRPLDSSANIKRLLFGSVCEVRKQQKKIVDSSTRLRCFCATVPPLPLFSCPSVLSQHSNRTCDVVNQGGKKEDRSMICLFCSTPPRMVNAFADVRLICSLFSFLPSCKNRTFSSTPVILLLVFVSCVAVVRSGTRCMIAAVATCAAVLTCFATMIANQSHYYSRQIAKSTTSSAHRVPASLH